MKQFGGEKGHNKELGRELNRDRKELILERDGDGRMKLGVVEGERGCKMG